MSFFVCSPPGLKPQNKNSLNRPSDAVIFIPYVPICMHLVTNQSNFRLVHWAVRSPNMTGVYLADSLFTCLCTPHAGDQSQTIVETEEEEEQRAVREWKDDGRKGRVLVRRSESFATVLVRGMTPPIPKQGLNFVFVLVKTERCAQ